MEIDGNITMLFNDDGLKIEVQDRSSSLTFLRIKMNPVQVSQAFSRLAHTDCENIEVHGIDKIGKKMEWTKFEFKFPDNIPHKERVRHAQAIAISQCPEGWEPDLYFESKDSFFVKDNIQYARCTIRRWI